MSPANADAVGPSLDAELRAAFISLVEERFALRLTEHQARRLDQAVVQALAVSDSLDARALCAAFRVGRHRDLFLTCVATLTIGETHFFRVGPQMEALRQVILPDVIDRRAVRRRLRAWSAGCSTGEEPHTLAILIRELLPNPEAWDVQILGTDISLPALEAARRAIYSEWSFRDTPVGVRQQYFEAQGGCWRLIDPLRRLVTFSHHNLAADSFPGSELEAAGFDLILCRNVTIYFGSEATQRLYRRFADALAPGGWLVLGPSDPTPEPMRALEVVNVGGVTLWRRRAAELPSASRRPAGVPATIQHPTAVGLADPAPAPLLRVIPEPARRQAAIPHPTADSADGPGHGESYGGDREGAREHAERLARERPLDAGVHLHLGMLHLDVGAIDTAIESLRRATFLDARSALSQFSLGRRSSGAEVKREHGQRSFRPAGYWRRPQMKMLSPMVTGC
jgi:chemotaxis protein methyltransferase CheR